MTVDSCVKNQALEEAVELTRVSLDSVSSSSLPSPEAAAQFLREMYGTLLDLHTDARKPETD